MMRLGVRVPSVKYCSQFSLRHSRHSRILGSSLSFNRFLSFVEICATFISRRDCRWTSVIAHFASWYPVFLSTACLADFPLFHGDIPGCLFCLPRYSAVVEISYRRIVPTIGFVGFSTFQIVFPSIPQIYKSSVFLFFFWDRMMRRSQEATNSGVSEITDHLMHDENSPSAPGAPCVPGGIQIPPHCCNNRACCPNGVATRSQHSCGAVAAWFTDVM